MKMFHFTIERAVWGTLALECDDKTTKEEAKAIVTEMIDSVNDIHEIPGIEMDEEETITLRCRQVIE